ncbi:Appr-1-p processing enzyme family protein [Heterostelium album PN500]|uniref:Appr-1-p processing enzyme family protein n=1 Tax=Heterostelium pallidum (strain ATCC 26659 / Pp 5 / PN500) TaxID=670386 RepID=D3BU81_HETP5|nr:Appr-1-p processing enzyme family protein [Heterostelium album PN500]EFA75015.1 Appr-1-p processing enzyme family protein [Heterostelium album PN500]|eukprot:XP_020427149.1 Appr-1-p processing enzyme family protein [Heterostelium album PN500]
MNNNNNNNIVDEFNIIHLNNYNHSLLELLKGERVVRIVISCAVSGDSEKQDSITSVVEKQSVVELFSEEFKLSITIDSIDIKEDNFIVRVESLKDCISILNNIRSAATITMLKSHRVQFSLILDNVLLVLRGQTAVATDKDTQTNQQQSITELLSNKLNIKPTNINYINDRIGLLSNNNNNNITTDNIKEITSSLQNNNNISLIPIFNNNTILFNKKWFTDIEEITNYIDNHLKSDDIIVSNRNNDNNNNNENNNKKTIKVQVGKDVVEYLRVNNSALAEFTADSIEIEMADDGSSISLIGKSEEKLQRVANDIKQFIDRNLTFKEYTISGYIKRAMPAYLENLLHLHPSIRVTIPKSQPVSRVTQVKLAGLYAKDDAKWNEIDSIMKQLAHLQRVWPSDTDTPLASNYPALRYYQLNQLQEDLCLYALSYDDRQHTFKLVARNQEDIDRAISILKELPQREFETVAKSIVLKSNFVLLTFFNEVSNEKSEINKILNDNEKCTVRLPLSEERHLTLYGKQADIDKLANKINSWIGGVEKSAISFEHQISASISKELHYYPVTRKLFTEHQILVSEVKSRVSSNTVLKSTKLQASGGVLLEVIKGSILEESTDCIVNAANESLAHGGGIAGAISRAAGRDFDNESHEYVSTHGRVKTGTAALTSAGKLNFKAVIHAVAPIWNSNKAECQQLVYSAINNTLIIANKQSFKSISIPVIGSGIYGVPKDIAAKFIVKAVVEFVKEHKKNGTLCLQNIRLCDIDYEALSQLQQSLDEVIKSQEKEKSETDNTANHIDSNEAIDQSKVKIIVTSTNNDKDTTIANLQYFIDNNIKLN